MVVNPFRMWGILVGSAHVLLVSAMYAQFHDEFISNSMEELPMFKLFMTTTVLCEIITGVFYVMSYRRYSIPYGLLVSILSALVSFGGWIVLCTNRADSRPHTTAVPIFCGGTGGYMICMLVVCSMVSNTERFGWIWITIFTLLSACTVAFVVAFLVAVVEDKGSNAIVFEWISYISLGVNFTVFFILTPSVPESGAMMVATDGTGKESKMKGRVVQVTVAGYLPIPDGGFVFSNPEP